MNNKVKVGIIGCGYWGPNLIRNFLEVKQAKVVAACDIDKKRLKFIKQRFPQLKITTNVKQFINSPQIDAIAIATPISTHYRLSIAALNANKHVLVEKPIASSTNKAKKLSNLATSKKLVLMVGHTFEYKGSVSAIKNIISENKLGKIYYVESSRVNLGLFQEDINVVWDLAPHDISIFNYILKKIPKKVLAVASNHITDQENLAYIILDYSPKLKGFINVNWLSPVKYRRMVIAGSKATIVYDDNDSFEPVKIYRSGAELKTIFSKNLIQKQLIYRTSDITIPKIDTTEPLTKECQEFIRSIINKSIPKTDGKNGIRVVAVLEAIQKSIKAGGKFIKVNI